MSTLVTGERGFVGSYLAATWPEVVGLGRVDVTDASALAERLSRLPFERVVHLAAVSFVPDSFADPARTLAVNLGGTLNLLQALDQVGFEGCLLYVGSGAVYGEVPPEQLPVVEDRPLRPPNPYAVSKVAAEALCYQWSRTSRYRVVMARPFNHTGPGQSERFFVPGLARQLVEISAGGGQAGLQLGDLGGSRDFSHVADVARAYQALLESGHNGEVYNVCSGRETWLPEVVERMQALIGLQVPVASGQRSHRPSEQKRMVASWQKLQAHTGWRPEHDLDSCLSDVLAYWREKLS
ncbi:MAG: GDP-mannose 4,6-dehydratase [Candidatus Eremiobacteraeota bacterium]|nr:GDP-mannose 4,6-dehydratase [Candidatus Eremiobacteraeota bacterium]